MRTLITGDRNIKQMDHVQHAKNDAPFEITEIVSGGTKGVEQLGERLARYKQLPCKEFEADWKNLKAEGARLKRGDHGIYNMNAGSARDKLMADYADCMILVHTEGVIDRRMAGLISVMEAQGKPVFKYPVPKKDTMTNAPATPE